MSLKVKRSKQNLSHEWKGTMKMGQLVPILCQEVLPGDWFKDQTNIIIKVSPLLAPIMHEVKAYTHFFFVPNRLIWSDWEDFITGGKDGNNSSTPPYVTSPEGGFGLSSLADYLNYEPTVAGYTASALPFRAYDLIYNQWYRDNIIQDELTISMASGSDTTTSIDLKNRNWEKDRYTSARPAPQLGSATYLPMAVTAPVRGTGKALGLTDGTHWVGLGHPINTYGELGGVSDAFNTAYGTSCYGEDHYTCSPDVSVGVTKSGSQSGLEADLSRATQVSIDDVNLGFQIQRWKQLNNIQGVRYIESILAHFGTRISDYKVGRSIFLGGGVSPLIVSEVLQTSSTDATSPQGNMAGHAFTAQRTHQFKHYFEEHGWIIGILSVMPKTAYQQGVPRKYLRQTRYDYAWPVFAHLGEQGITEKEIYVQGTSADAGIFGYEPRYDEYRHEESSVHGDFRSTLNYWHMGRIFDSAPTLSSQFITSDPTQRINVSTATDNLRVWVGHELYAVRPLPKYGTPKIGV